MKLNVSLSPKDILEKNFKVVAKGFRPQEVDEYLDTIIQDYSAYNRFINSIARENKDLIDENNRLKNELRRVKLEYETLLENNESNKSSTSNLDILKRLSNLEKAVYGSNNNDDE